VSLRNPNQVNPHRPKRVALVIANAALSSTSGWPVGFWWSELTHPYYLMTERGYEVTVFSPDGGECIADAMSDPRDATGYSASDLITMGFIGTPRLLALVDNTKPVSEMDVNAFDAILVAGGQAPMFNFAKAEALQKKYAEFFEQGKLVCALCHGVALLRYVRLQNGELLAYGKTVTGFTNAEEEFSDNAVWSMDLLPRGTHVMPWRIEDELKRIGANFIHAGLWQGFAVRDGNLITGQQNFSGAETAELLIASLGA